MSEGFVRVARSLRGEWTENIHFGVAAVSTPEGKLVAGLGDPQRRVFLRSAAKPIQILPLLAAGGREAFDLSAREIALMCSSHSGSDAHVEAVGQLMTRSKLPAQALACGVHPPLDEPTAEELRRRGTVPSSLHNNCSANHLGQLLACRLLGWPLEGYRAPDHPLQSQVRSLVARFAGLEPESVQIGVDGCGLPSFRMPTQAAAAVYARFADPSGGGVPADLVEHVDLVVEAMALHPDMVSGPRRFTSELIRVTGGRLIGKEGAEGFYGVVVRGPVALGIAVKIIDGTEKCRDAVVVELLRQAGCLSQAEYRDLTEFHQTKLENHSGDPIGVLVAELELEEIEPGGVTAHSAG